jgi:hypothetical protein
MVIPCPYDPHSSFKDNAHDTRKITGIEAVAFGDGDVGLEPDFGVFAAAFDMNMARLARLAFIREKVITETAVAEHDRHRHLKPSPE